MRTWDPQDVSKRGATWLDHIRSDPRDSHRHNELVQELESVRAKVPAASDMSLLRIFDVM